MKTGRLFIMSNKIKISVIIPITEKKRDINVAELYPAYKQSLEAMGKTYEFVCVLDGNYPHLYNDLQALREKGEPIKILKLSKRFGESTALSAGFAHSSGDFILTLPAYQQIKIDELPKLMEAITGYDMVIARRYPRADSFVNQLQSRIFHSLVKHITGYKFNDLGSGVRLMRRKILEEVQVYGDQYRFLPLWASRYGFRVREIKITQSEKDAFQRLYAPGVYIRRLLDILSVFFLIKFTKKPLRFFGLTGFFIFALGALLLIFLFIQRMFMGIGLADRPIVLVGLLLFVVGIQILAIGLIGEIIIFTHAKELKEYTIEQVVN